MRKRTELFLKRKWDQWKQQRHLKNAEWNPETANTRTFLHDPLAVAMVIRPDFVTHFVEERVAVDKKTGITTPTGDSCWPVIRVTRDVHYKAFREFLIANVSEFIALRGNEVRFYQATGEYGFLSNLFLRNISFEGKTFRSSEDAYQYGKPKDRAVAEWLIAAPNPRLGALAAHALLHYDIRSDWDDIKVKRMRDVLKTKFTTHPDLAQKLIATGHALPCADRGLKDRRLLGYRQPWQRREHVRCAAYGATLGATAPLRNRCQNPTQRLVCVSNRVNSVQHPLVFYDPATKRICNDADGYPPSIRGIRTQQRTMV